MLTTVTLLLAGPVVCSQHMLSDLSPTGWVRVCVCVCLASFIVCVCVWGMGRSVDETSRGASFPPSLGPAAMLITVLLMDPD